VCKKYTPELWLQREQKQYIISKDFELKGQIFRIGEMHYTEKGCKYLVGHYECLIKARRR
jgi:hypothetical protein